MDISYCGIKIWDLNSSENMDYGPLDCDTM
jgi:hypothetical protein